MREDREKINRLLAGAGMALLLAGLLMALSLVVVGLAVLALTALVLVGAAVGWLLRRVTILPALESATSRAAAASRGAWAHAPRPLVRKRARQLAARAKAAGVNKRARQLAARAKAAGANAPHRTEAAAARALTLSLKGMYRTGLLRLHSADPSRLAEELNARGARLRREGEPEQAAEEHRAALAIVRNLGDQRAEAITLNNLGLALAHTGAGGAAVEYLAQAADVLRELGDEEYEGQVIANLGIVYRRQGHGDEAAILLQEALAKLPPASPAYRQVEEELSRAS